MSKPPKQPSCEDAPRRNDGLLTTGDMARLSNSTLRTVRFYEEARLLCPRERSDGGHRLFPRSELLKLKLIGDLREAGLSLEEIREMLEAKRRGPCGRSASTALLERIDKYVACLHTRIELLSRLIGELESTRELIASCKQCRRTDLFPNECGECEVMTDSKRIPLAASVLWSVEES